MKKTIFTLILFLAVCLVVPAQAYKITRHAVGTGGFLNMNENTTDKKMSGLFGQAITGKIEPTIDGEKHTMYLGFWSPIPLDSSGIDNMSIFQTGIYNYPNPVADVTNFNFSLSEQSFVTIKVYNTLGSLVAIVTNNEMCSEGMNSISWSIRNLSVGLTSDSYLYEMTATPVNLLSSTVKPVSFRNVMVIAK